MRDINLESTVFPRFTTRTTTGVPTTLSGTPVLSVYEENNLTQITAGVSVTVDYDSVTGLNQATIVATVANGYEAGKSYDVVITTGTVGGVSVVGEVAVSFTIEDSAIGLNATAKAALEDQYDGTGLTGDTYPATQEQGRKIVSTGAATNVVAESYTLTTGTQSANLYTDTAPLDETRHEHTDTAGVMDLYYQFDVGTHGVPTGVTTVGYISSKNDQIGIYAYSWAGTSWDQIGSIQGTDAAINETISSALYTSHVGDGVNVGKVRIRFYEASGLTTATLAIDQLYTSYATVPETAHIEGVISDISPTTSGFDTDLTSANGFWDDALLVFKSGNLEGQSRPVATYLNANGAVTFDEPTTLAPANGDKFYIEYSHIHPISQIQSGLATEAKQDIIDTNVDSILVDTNELQADWADGGRLDLIQDDILVDTGTTIPAQISGLNNISVSDLLTTQMTEAYSVDGTAPTLAQALFLIQQTIGDFSISGTTLTAKRLDGTSTAATYTLDDAANPTSRTRST